MDDAKARADSEMAGLIPIGTLWLLLKAVKNHLLNFDQFLSTFEGIVQAGFYLKEEVYLKAVRKARELSHDWWSQPIIAHCGEAAYQWYVFF